MLLGARDGHKAVDLRENCISKQNFWVFDVLEVTEGAASNGAPKHTTGQTWEARNYLIWSGLRRGGWSLGEDVMAGRNGRAWLSVPRPIWARLRVDAVVPVPMGHVLRGWLTVRALWWVRVLRRARLCYARVYRDIIVRFDLLVVLLGILMVASILQRH